MNWIKFILWLSGIYTTYYTLIIFWDNSIAQKSKKDESDNELTFIEDIEPVRPEGTQNPAVPPSPVVSSGGVTIRQLFSLAQQEAIEFTRPVSFS